MGELLGYENQAQISRHETADVVPLLVCAFGYQVIFRVPVHELFPQIYEDVRGGIEQRLRTLEASLHGRTVRGREAEAIAKTLLWMMERRDRDIEMTDAG